MLRFLLIGFLCGFLAIPGVAQLDNRVFEDRLTMDPVDSGRWYGTVQSLGFFRNNEFFGTIVDGYTMFGFQLQPTLSYHVSKRVRVDAGVYLQKDFGNSRFSTAAPVFSLKWTTGNFAMIFGNLESSVNHRLIEPLYDFERLLNNRIETGTQFLYQRDGWFVDFWVDWQYMQYWRDTHQEQLVGGLSVLKRVAKLGSTEISLPLQLLTRHQGGQLDVVDLPIQTLVNSAIGIQTRTEFSGWLTAFQLQGYYCYDKDLTHARQAYADGDGWYINASVQTKHGLQVMASYWNANEFQSFQGGPIYQAVSTFDGERLQPAPQLMMMRVLYNRKITDQLNLTVRYEPYMDLATHHFQYTYAFYLNYRQRFRLNR